MNDTYFLGKVCDPGQEVQLLIDGSAIEDRWDVECRLNQPEKHPKNPVVTADQPWEESIGGPSVLYDAVAQRFRMWYALYDSTAWGHQYRTSEWDPARHGYPYMVSYATGSPVSLPASKASTFDSSSGARISSHSDSGPFPAGQCRE